MVSQKTFEFLVENRLRNDKEWFLEHKNDYNSYVLQPLTELATRLADTLLKIDSMIVTEPKVDKTISRIYRDTRFSKDKSLYREDMWLSFKRDKKIYLNYPEFFFVITPNEFLYGCGYYAATTETMNSMRELIINKDKTFIHALKDYENQQIFVIEGSTYKKNKYIDQAENIQNWLNRKQICFTHKSTDSSLLFSENLPQIISEQFMQLKSIYNFFINAEIKKVIR